MKTGTFATLIGAVFNCPFLTCPALAQQDLEKECRSAIAELNEKAEAKHLELENALFDAIEKLKSDFVSRAEMLRVKAMEEDDLDAAIHFRDLKSKLLSLTKESANQAKTDPPPDAVKYEKSAYLLVKKALPHYLAAQDAHHRGAHLLRINSQPEFEFIEGMLRKQLENPGMFWIDGSDAASEGDWRYSNGELIDSAWLLRFPPDNFENSEHAMRMYLRKPDNSFRLDDYKSDARLFYLIEWDEDGNDRISDLSAKPLTDAERFERLFASFSNGFNLSQNEKKMTMFVNEWHGREGLLRSHPLGTKFKNHIPISFRWEGTLAKPLQPKLQVSVCNTKNFRLVIKVSGKIIHDAVIGGPPRWRDLEFDLSQFPGRNVVIEVIHAANDWDSEHAFWSRIRVVDMNGNIL